MRPAASVAQAGKNGLPPASLSSRMRQLGSVGGLAESAAGSQSPTTTVGGLSEAAYAPRGVVDPDYN